MAIKVRCPGCRQKIRYSQAPTGRVGRCPRCGTVVLTMEDGSDADASIGPAASHDAIVPCPQRRTRPDEDTVVFTPLFPSPGPARPTPPLAVATMPWSAPSVRLPVRRPVLSRRRLVGVCKRGASFSRRGHNAPVYAAGAGSVVGDMINAVGLAALLGLSLVGASIMGIWLIVILTQFP